MNSYEAPIRKHPDEAPKFTFDALPLLGGGLPSGIIVSSAALIAQDKTASLTGTPAWATSTDLTISALAVAIDAAQATVAGGTDGTFYRITIRFTLSDTSTVVGAFYFNCRR